MTGTGSDCYTTVGLL